MTRFQRKRGYTNNNSGDGGVLDLTNIKPSSNITDYNKIFCEFCDVPLIKKMDDPGDLNEKRYICCRCGNIHDPLRLGDLDNVKHVEKGQTIRSSSSSSTGGGSEEGRPFVEMFNNSITAAGDKGSLLRKGTQLSRALLQTDIIKTNDDLEPNEEENMRSQNMRILKTETTYPESGRKVVKTFDDG